YWSCSGGLGIVENEGVSRGLLVRWLGREKSIVGGLVCVASRGEGEKVKEFTRDNNYTIEFDAFGFSVKDFLTRHILLRCDSSGDLYPVTKSSTLLAAFVSTSSTTWHQRLGHPKDEVLRSLSSQALASSETSVNLSMTTAIGSACRHLVTQTVGIIRPWLLLERAHMANCNPSRTPVDTDSKLGPDGIPVCLYMHDPREPHFAALKRILGYVQGTLELGLHLYASATTSLIGYTDADWAGCPSTRMSTFGYCVFLASFPVPLQQIVDSLHKEFDMTDLEALNYFLGIFVVRHRTGLFLSSKKYALQLLERAHMANCNPSRTPVDTDSKLGPDGIPVQDPTLCRSLAGGFSILHLLTQICTMQFS
nr:ribonuclease H-like domain-containing protein [Tanacetum cinerariifolium]